MLWKWIKIGLKCDGIEWKWINEVKIDENVIKMDGNM